MKPIQIGSMSITRIVETDSFSCDPKTIYAEPGSLETLDRASYGYLVRTGHLKIIVDTGRGTNIAFLDNLLAAGLKPDEIDVVFCTNLDDDRIGWNTRLVDGKWVPTFPNATYVLTKESLTYYSDLHAHTPNPYFERHVLPITAANLELLVDPAHLFETGNGENLRLQEAKGHVPGQTILHVQSADKHAIFGSDLIPDAIVVEKPDLNVTADVDPVGAVAARKRLFAAHVDKETIFIPGHAPDPVAGRIVTDGDAYRFAWLDEAN